MDTAIIIPVHNRCDITLRCLVALENDGVLTWATVYVVDDGSTDGTAEKVRERFPSVRLLRGDGKLWWTGAISLGMGEALKDGAEYLFWLNDDTLPEAGACRRLRGCAVKHRGLVTGQCQAENGAFVYGGLIKSGVEFVLRPVEGETLVVVEACSGNFVAMSAAVAKAVGSPDAKRFPQAFGDLDYALRAGRLGYPVGVDPTARAKARPDNPANTSSWLLGEISIADIWRSLWTKKSYTYAPAHLRFLWRHFGLRGVGHWTWSVLKRVPITVLRLLIPRTWLRAVWGRRSRAWSEEQRLKGS